jgi:LacI family transcriptional regulator, galactose operon repressor
LRNRLRNGHVVTLADVAKRAGVSASTASRALNGRGELSDETRAAVADAARELQFQPSQLARSLRTSTTHTVGFVVPDVSSPFYAAALKGAQTTLHDAGYRTLLMDCEQSADREVEALQTLLAHRVDGLLVSTVGLDREQFEEVTGGRVPCVFFDSSIDDTGEGSVILDNHRGIELLVGHLVEHGHRRIGLLAGSPSETSGFERRAAFEAVMARHSPDVSVAGVAGREWSLREGERAGFELLRGGRPPTAIVASSVELALGAMRACRDLGVRVPDDLALASFDDAYFAELLDPPLTAVAYQPRAVGEAAARLLVEAMGDDEPVRRDLSFDVQLVVRGSCGCTA